MEDTTISSGLAAATPVELTPMSEDEGERAIESFLSGDALPKGDNVAEEKAPTDANSDEEDALVINADEDDGQTQETAQAPAQPQEPGDEILVTLSDGQKISLGELKKSPFLHRDYTFKTESHKRAVQEFEARKSAEEQRISQQRDAVLAYAQQHMPQPPDMSMMDSSSPNYNPLEFIEQRTRYEQTMGQLNAIWQEREAEQHALAEQQQQQAQALRAQEQVKLYQALPKLKDEAKRNAFIEEIKTILPKSYGIKAEEVLGLNSAAAMHIVHDALAYRKALARGQAVVKELPTKPKLEGRQRSHPASDLERDAQGRFKALRETGSVAAADAAIEAFLLRKG